MMAILYGKKGLAFAHFQDTTQTAIVMSGFERTESACLTSLLPCAPRADDNVGNNCVG